MQNDCEIVKLASSFYMGKTNHLGIYTEGFGGFFAGRVKDGSARAQTFDTDADQTHVTWENSFG